MISILTMLTVAYISCFLWIISNNFHFEEGCREDSLRYSNFVEDMLIFLIASNGSMFIIADQLAYWLLACKYWELSYNLEEVIKPLGYKPRPKWHFKVEKAMVGWILFWPLMTLITYLIYILNYTSKYTANNLFFGISAFMSGIQYVSSLFLLCYTIKRVYWVTSGSDFVLKQNLVILNFLIFFL